MSKDGPKALALRAMRERREKEHAARQLREAALSKRTVRPK